MMIRALTITIVILAALSASGQRTTRPKLTLEAAQSSASASAGDTIREPDIAISGFEKTLRSTRESLFATNYTSDTISAIAITIDYLDMNGRQLHRRSLTLTPPAPMAPGQTRQFEFKSWDSQRVWHYRLSLPPRTKGQATPFDVMVKVDYAIKPSALRPR